jgi:hypothetical protein
MAAARAANSGGGGGAKFSLLNRGSSKQDGVATGIFADEGRERGSGGSRNPQLTVLPHASDIKWIDQFPYYPAYRYHSYRSYCGACSSILFLTILLLRFSTSIMDFVNRPPIVTEAREQFERDSTITYRLPRVGVQFRQNGWRPFIDPRYLSIIFEQGVISMSGNVSYVDLGTHECAFVDRDGRLIADGAMCPLASGDAAGYLQGDFHDVTFAFVRARLARCDNGTDVEGKPLPGMCMMPSEIDRLVYDGVLYMFEQETDMRVDESSPFLRIRQWRREFISRVHLSTDVYFTVRKVTVEPKYIFDAYLPGFKAGDSFTLLHSTQETYTDFEEEAAQYAAFYFRLAPELIRQSRSYTSLFDLFETWGAIVAFLYLVFGLTARSFNAFHFNRQVRGLDLRKLDKGQFTPFGRLIDKSFQMPREFQSMTAD